MFRKLKQYGMTRKSIGENLKNLKSRGTLVKIRGENVTLFWFTNENEFGEH